MLETLNIGILVECFETNKINELLQHLKKGLDSKTFEIYLHTIFVKQCFELGDKGKTKSVEAIANWLIVNQHGFVGYYLLSIVSCLERSPTVAQYYLQQLNKLYSAKEEIKEHQKKMVKGLENYLRNYLSKN